MDRQEAATVVVGVEERQLLTAMHAVLGVVPPVPRSLSSGWRGQTRGRAAGQAMSSRMRHGTSAKLSQKRSTIASIMQMSIVFVGRLSRRHSVGCEQSSGGRWPTAILKAGSSRKASQSLASG